MPLKNYYEENKDYANFQESDFEPVIEPQDAFEAFDSAFDYSVNDTMSSLDSAQKESEKRLTEQFVKIVGKSPDDIISENDGGFVTNVKENVYGFVDHDYKINRALELLNDDGKYRGQLTDFNLPFYERRNKIMQERDKAQQDSEYANLSTASNVGAFLGGTARIMVDPVNLLTMFIPTGGATALGRIGFASLTEAGIQAIQEPAIQLTRGQAGLDYGLDRSLDNIFMAGIGGAAFQGLGEFVGLGYRKIFKPNNNVFDPKTEQSIIDINDQASTSIATTNANLERIKQAHNGEPVSSFSFTPRGFDAHPVSSVVNGKKIQTITDTPVNIRIKANESIPAKMVLVEADDLITSNLDDGMVNDLYPPDLQPRDRSSFASQIQVNDIAQDIDPDLLINGSSASHGAPIIGDDFVVDSGNGRVMALRKAMNNYPDSYNNYKSALIDNGYDLAGFKNPVLVRMRTDSMDTPSRIKFTQTANKSAIAKMSVSEQAFMDKDAIEASMLNLYAGGDIAGSANKHFIRSFVDKNVSANDTSDFITKGGQLSQNGKTRIEAALLAKALNNKKIVSDYFETTDPDLKSILGALSDSAPHLSFIAHNKKTNISDNIVQAIDILKRSRSDKTNISDLINQIDLERGEVSPLTTEILRAMHRNDSFKQLAGREKIASIMSDYTRRTSESDLDTPDLLGQKLSPLDHLRGAIAASRGEKAPQIPLKEFMEAGKKNNTDIIPDDLFNKAMADAKEYISQKPDIENTTINKEMIDVDKFFSKETYTTDEIFDILAKSSYFSKDQLKVINALKKHKDFNKDFKILIDPKDIKYEALLNNSYFNATTNELIVRKHKSFRQADNPLKIETVLLHELTHAFSAKFINKHFDKPNTKEFKLLKNLETIILESKPILEDWVKSSPFNDKTNKHINFYYKYFTKGNDIQISFGKQSPNKLLGNEALYNEFLAVTLSDVLFANKLKNATLKDKILKMINKVADVFKDILNIPKTESNSIFDNLFYNFEQILALQNIDSPKIIKDVPDIEIQVKDDKGVIKNVSAKEYFEELADDDKALSESINCLLG